MGATWVGERSGVAAGAVPQSRRAHALQLVLLLGALVPPLVIAHLIARYGVDVPFWDQWDFVPLLAASRDGSLTFDQLWAQHNEHRILLPRLVMLGLAAITRWDVRVEMWTSFGFALATLAALAVAIRRTTGALAPWLILVASWIVFSPAQWENWTWGWQLQVFMHVFAVAVVGASLTFRRAAPAFAVLLGAVTIGLLCFASGVALLLLAPFAVAFAPWSFGSFGRRRYVITATCFVIVLGVVYLVEFRHPGGHPSLLTAAAQPVTFARYVMVFLGAALSVSDSTGAAFWGATGLVILLVSVGGVWITSPLHRAAVVPWIAIAGYSVLASLMIGIGRVGFGVDQALSSRYVTITTPFWVSVVVMAALCVARMLATEYSRTAMVLAVALGCAAVIGARSYRTSWKIGEHALRDRASKLLALRTCVRYITHAPADCLLRGYPNLEGLRVAAATLEMLGAGPFKDPPELLARAQRRSGTPPVLRGTRDGRPGLLAAAPSDIALPIGGAARRLHLEFGIAARAWEGREEQTDGVEFRVTTGTEEGATILWSRRLDPVRLPRDRGAQTIDIDLPEAVDTVILQTRPAGDTRSDWSYWAAARTP